MNITEIILGCKKKDRRAEKELYNAFSPFVLNICIRYSKDTSQAKDYLQECFIHLFHKVSKFDSKKGAFKSWLQRLCVNRILELKRKDKVLKIELNEAHYNIEQIDEADIDYVSQKDLISAVRKLPDGYRNVLNLYVFENLSHAEIGSVLGISEGSSRSQLSRSKQLLKKILIQTIPNINEKRLA